MKQETIAKKIKKTPVLMWLKEFFENFKTIEILSIKAKSFKLKFISSFIFILIIPMTLLASYIIFQLSRVKIETAREKVELILAQLEDIILPIERELRFHYQAGNKNSLINFLIQARGPLSIQGIRNPNVNLINIEEFIQSIGISINDWNNALNQLKNQNNTSLNFNLQYKQKKNISSNNRIIAKWKEEDNMYIFENAIQNLFIKAISNITDKASFINKVQNTNLQVFYDKSKGGFIHGRYQDVMILMDAVNPLETKDPYQYQIDYSDVITKNLGINQPIWAQESNFEFYQYIATIGNQLPKIIAEPFTTTNLEGKKIKELKTFQFIGHIQDSKRKNIKYVGSYIYIPSINKILFYGISFEEILNFHKHRINMNDNLIYSVNHNQPSLQLLSFADSVLLTGNYIIIFVFIGVLFFTVESWVVRPARKLIDIMQDFINHDKRFFYKRQINVKADEFTVLFRLTMETHNTHFNKIKKQSENLQLSTYRSLSNQFFMEELSLNLDQLLKNRAEMIEHLTAGIHRTKNAQEQGIKIQSHLSEVTNDLNDIEIQTNQISTSLKEYTQTLQEIFNLIEVEEEVTESLLNNSKNSQIIMSTLTASIQEVSGNAKNIVGMVQFIMDIAEQTHLLAMNAAIEAAHAGELGKGFAVVAEEIRKLADKSTLGAQDIQKLVRDIHSNINMNVKLVEKTALNFQQLNENIHKIQDITATTQNHMRDITSKEILLSKELELIPTVQTKIKKRINVEITSFSEENESYEKVIHNLTIITDELSQYESLMKYFFMITQSVQDNQKDVVSKQTQLLNHSLESLLSNRE